MDSLEKIIEKHHISGKYQNKTKKARFNQAWSILVGFNCRALGANSFDTPHKFKNGKGVCLTPIEERNIPLWKKKVWLLVKQLLELIDADMQPASMS